MKYVNRKKVFTAAITAAMLAGLLAGSGSALALGNSQYSTGSVTVLSAATGASADSDVYTERDLAQSADLSEAKTLTVSDNSTVEITESGTYVLTGTATNCIVKITVTDEKAKVQLVLDGVSITNDALPCIYVVEADKVFITTAEGSDNSLTVTGSFVADGETNTDAVIFSKDDLTLNGLGTLTVVSYDGNGISCKDDLKVTGGSYVIQSADDGIEVNDSINICGGTFTIQSYKDAIHCENDEDYTLGSIAITDGSFTIEAASDGIQATTTLVIDGGSFDLKATEAIEATNITINGGTVKIYATDDGINATAKSKACEVAITVNGGDITIEMGQGDTDALDANGSIYINGGTLNITANSPFDYDRVGQLNGGTVTVNGTQVSELTNQMMGGPGNMGGFGGGFGGQMGGFGGQGAPSGDFGGGMGRPGGDMGGQGGGMGGRGGWH